MKNLSSVLIVLILAFAAFAQTNEFSYQGFLNDNSASANGNYDFEFRFYTNSAGGSPLFTQQRLNVVVTNGVFNVVLDFGQIFPSAQIAPNGLADIYLETAVKLAGSGSFTTLTPRSKLLATPFASISTLATQSQNAVTATNATTANNALNLGGVLANQFVQTNDSRLSDARNPLPNSANYIQNGTLQQSLSNFNISGNGTAAGTLSGTTVNAGLQYNIGGGRVLAKFGQNNLYLGTLAGAANGGIQNTLVGDSAGKDTTGNENAMFGFVAGQNSTTGSNNSFLGSRAGTINLTGSNNTLVGAYSNFGANNMNNAASFGYRSFVETNNSIVLGGVNGKNGATSDTSVGIGTTAPEAPLDIESAFLNSPPNVPSLRLTNYGRFSLIRGRSAGGTRTLPTAVTNGSNIFTITADGYRNGGFSDLGMASIFFKAAETWTTTANGTAIEFGTTPNGTTTEQIRMRIDQNGNVAIGAILPAQKLDVNGNVRVGTGTTGCIEDRDGTVIAGTCSSDLRFKKNVTPFGNVLNNFSKLRPVNYNWRSEEFTERKFGEKTSYGLIAQEVEELFPDLVATDEKGYKAINYSKLPIYTIQAVKELKAENDELKEKLESQQKQMELQQKLVEDLRKAVCETNPQTAVCK